MLDDDCLRDEAHIGSIDEVSSQFFESIENLEGIFLTGSIDHLPSKVHDAQTELIDHQPTGITANCTSDTFSPVLPNLWLFILSTGLVSEDIVTCDV